MNFDRDIDAFIRQYVKDIRDGSAAIFAGAGMSRSAGYVDWATLLEDIADEIGLKAKEEHDLVALAQYHVNKNGNPSGLQRKILEEFSDQARPTKNHEILANLPIRTYWTTNYDSLIEDALENANKRVDTKRRIDDLATTRPKRDVTVYKMHGDVKMANEAIIRKEQYERYYITHDKFITALSGDLTSNTFLFIGFSFTDPNIDYVLSRLNAHPTDRQHYCFIKREERQGNESDEQFAYKSTKQELRIGELKRYRIKALLVDSYDQITEILAEMAQRFKKNTIFISGSAEDYGTWQKNDALNFIHDLSKKIVSNGYTIINGFGWGVGSAIINGALEEIYENPAGSSPDQLVMHPFPQTPSKDKDLKQLWEDYRQRIISPAGIAIFLFGNKVENKEITLALGVRREWEIAIEKGLIPIPIAATGFVAKEIWEEISEKIEEYYPNPLLNIIKSLNEVEKNPEKIIQLTIEAIKAINR